YENIERMLMATEQVDKNEITLEEFAGVVEWFENVVNRYSKNYTPRPPMKLDGLPHDQRELADKLMQLTDQAEEDFKEAVQNFRAAIEHFRSYLEEPDKESLAEGSRF